MIASGGAAAAGSMIRSRAASSSRPTISAPRSRSTMRSRWRIATASRRRQALDGGGALRRCRRRRPAKRLPSLKVGLHLQLSDGRPLLPPEQVAALIGRDEISSSRKPGPVRFFFDPQPRQFGQDRGAIRFLRRHRPRPRPCQRASAHASSPHCRGHDDRDRQTARPGARSACPMSLVLQPRAPASRAPRPARALRWWTRTAAPPPDGRRHANLRSDVRPRLDRRLHRDAPPACCWCCCRERTACPSRDCLRLAWVYASYRYQEELAAFASPLARAAVRRRAWICSTAGDLA